MPKPSMRRSRTLFERSTTWIIITLVLGGALVAGSYFGIRSVRERVELTQARMFLMISGFGVVSLLLILVTYTYQVRKRLLQEDMGGTLMAWLRSHAYLGLLSVVAAAAHATLFPLTNEISSGKVTGAILTLLVLSGILWRTVYARVPRLVPTRVGNLAFAQTHDEAEATRVELEKLKAGRSKGFIKAVDELVATPRKLEQTERAVVSLDIGERNAWDQAKVLVEKLQRKGSTEGTQRRLTRFMQGWKTIHLPLAALLLGSIAFHIYDVANLDRFLKSEPQKQFASASDCARCHSEIVDEWRLSMHRNAGTSTTTVAQSKFALALFPEFGKACVNCHQPLGVKFSQKASFPLAADPGSNPESSVENEGVTCVVCHTMPHAPPEMAGASDKLPIGKRSATSFGVMFGPPLRQPDQIPTSAHDVAVGFMTSTVTASQMCATCHNVKVDINGNGIVDPALIEVVKKAGGAPIDSNANGRLDENELDVKDGILQDLVLQTTYDEWQDYMFSNDGQGAACVDCHMPSAGRKPLIDRPPLSLRSEPRQRHKHIFVAVDYDLNGNYYRQKGMPRNAMQTVLEERERFISQAASVSVTVQAPNADGKIIAKVTVKGLEGHSFPTGFAFARQFWLDVSARTGSGKQVCLTADPRGVPSPCGSGKIASVTDELATCENQGPGLAVAAEPFGPPRGQRVKLASSQPLEHCDPWLTNFQKVLTDGDPDHDGTFNEVAHQSLLANVVKLRVRTADGQSVGPIPSGGSQSFDYAFDAAGAEGQPLQVKAILRLRHLPPYFVRALRSFEPVKGLDPDKLLLNMTVVDVASNEPLPAVRTTPAPETFADVILALPQDKTAKPKAIALALIGLLALAAVALRTSSSRY